MIEFSIVVLIASAAILWFLFRAERRRKQWEIIWRNTEKDKNLQCSVKTHSNCSKQNSEGYHEDSDGADSNRNKFGFSESTP